MKTAMLSQNAVPRPLITSLSLAKSVRGSRRSILYSTGVGADLWKGKGPQGLQAKLLRLTGSRGTREQVDLRQTYQHHEHDDGHLTRSARIVDHLLTLRTPFRHRRAAPYKPPLRATACPRDQSPQALSRFELLTCNSPPFWHTCLYLSAGVANAPVRREQPQATKELHQRCRGAQ